MLDDLFSKLSDLQQKARALDGSHSVPFTELFTDEFMLRNTEFSSITGMIEASGFKVEFPEDFAAIPDEPWDQFIAQRTRFTSWEDMKAAAGREWIASRLGLG